MVRTPPRHVKEWGTNPAALASRMLGSLRRWAARWPYDAAATVIGALVVTFVASLLLAKELGTLGAGGGFLGMSTLAYAVCGALDPDAPFDARQAATWFTYAFLHGGLFHILMNSMSIHQLGRMLEVLTMPRNVYMTFLAGVLGGAATVELWAAVQGGRHPITVGASAGACGLLGALLALTYKARGGFFGELRKELLSSTILLVIIGFLPGISGAGHVGGLVAGALCGLVIRKRGSLRLPNDTLTVVPDVLTALTGAACLAAVLWVAATAPQDAKLLRTAKPLLRCIGTFSEWLDASAPRPTAADIDEWVAELDGLDVPRSLRPIGTDLLRLAHGSGLLDGRTPDPAKMPEMRAAAETLFKRAAAVVDDSGWFVTPR